MGAIGVFDSGFGGLSILKHLQKELPKYDFIYLGDNARTPYGSRSFETIYEYTRQCVFQLFELGCPLVVLACNTASAKALRTIQQVDLPKKYPNHRVLGIIRPIAEESQTFSANQILGLLATKGTISSKSYDIEVSKHSPEVSLYSQACPMWVPLVENNAWKTPGGLFFLKEDVNQLIQQNPKINTILLACTHYPHLKKELSKYFPQINFVEQGPIVAIKLKDYLIRHPEISHKLSQKSVLHFYSTENPDNLNLQTQFFHTSAPSFTHIHLPEINN